MFGLTNDTWGLIILGLLGYFFVRLISQLDKLSNNVALLNVTITKIESDATGRYSIMDSVIKEHHSAIEQSRSRIHKIRNLLTIILLQAQRAGWKIDIPDIDGDEKV